MGLIRHGWDEKQQWSHKCSALRETSTVPDELKICPQPKNQRSMANELNSDDTGFHRLATPKPDGKNRTDFEDQDSEEEVIEEEFQNHTGDANPLFHAGLISLIHVK